MGDKLTDFIFKLKMREDKPELGKIDDPISFNIHEAFSVKGTG